VVDRFLYGFLESHEEVVGGEEAGPQAGFDLKGILPIHGLDPPLDLNKVTVREESHLEGIHTGNADGTGFTLCVVAYLLELDEIFWVRKNDTKVVRVWSDSSMRGVNRRYTVARLVFPFAFDPLRSTAIVALLLKIWRCMQIEYNDYCGSTLSYAERW
jgi:hypothetical protein